MNRKRARSLGQSHPRPNLSTPYVAPRTEIEQRLANIWQQMLGIDEVSIHDNFFELGGDSVQAIQISVKINEAGLQFTPQQLFQNQTIAELAAILDSTPANGSTTVETICRRQILRTATSRSRV